MSRGWLVVLSGGLVLILLVGAGVSYEVYRTQNEKYERAQARYKREHARYLKAVAAAEDAQTGPREYIVLNLQCEWVWVQDSLLCAPIDESIGDLRVHFSRGFVSVSRAVTFLQEYDDIGWQVIARFPRYVR